MPVKFSKRNYDAFVTFATILVICFFVVLLMSVAKCHAPRYVHDHDKGTLELAKNAILNVWPEYVMSRGGRESPGPGDSHQGSSGPHFNRILSDYFTSSLTRRFCAGMSIHTATGQRRLLSNVKLEMTWTVTV